MQIVFGFEVRSSYSEVKGDLFLVSTCFQYAILLVSVLSTVIKYVLHVIEIRTGEQWENKGVFMLYSDLVLGFFRLGLYMIFIIVMMKIHTFPLFAIRPMFIAMRYLTRIECCLLKFSAVSKGIP